MDSALIVQLIALGLSTGFVAGLLGVGGGAIMVPFLVSILENRNIDTGLAVKMAIATSMATIVFTSISSVRAHHKARAVRWDLFARLAPGIIAGGLISSLGVFAILKGSVLAAIFTVFLIVTGLRMFRAKTTQAERDLPGTLGVFGAGSVIGFFSGLVGIGGGSLSVPFMTWCSINIRNAVATSAALGFPIAVSNVIGYITMGQSVPGLPAYSLGYIWLPAVVVMAVCSVTMAPLGAKTAHRLPVLTLRRVFAILLFLLAMYMLYKTLAG